jgi:hypothetical protein
MKMSAKIWKSIVVAGTISLLWSPSVTIASVIITKQPESQIADYDGNATLSVIAFTLNEYLPLTYQWYRGTEEIEGANLPVLNLSGLKRGDDAVYYIDISSTLCGIEKKWDSSGVGLQLLRGTSPSRRFV